MDKKGQLADAAYPNIVFCADNFEEVSLGTREYSIYVTVLGSLVSRRLVIFG